MGTDKTVQKFLLRLQDMAQQQIPATRGGHQVPRGYVFRGEFEAEGLGERPRPVTSQLYRWVQNECNRSNHPTPGILDYAPLSDKEKQRLPALQDRVLDYLNEMLLEPYAEEEKSKLLARIQHFGGRTNLIDFTRDYLVALFFACYDQQGEENDSGWLSDGRIIFLPDDCRIIRPQIGDTRAVVQKSVFRWEPQGLIPENEYETLPVPKELKFHLLSYLAGCHDIRPRTIFPDFTAALRYVSSYSVLSSLWDETTVRKET